MLIVFLLLISCFIIGFPVAFGNEDMIWETNTPIPTPRAEMAFATYDEKIYLIGGFDETESALDVVEAFDTKTNSWSTLAPQRPASSAAIQRPVSSKSMAM